MGGKQGNDLDLTKLRLCEWGVWTENESNPSARGYGRSCLNDSVTSVCSQDMPPPVQEVESEICCIKQINGKMAEALHQRYAMQASNEVGATRIGVGKTKFQELVTAGETSVARGLMERAKKIS